MTDTVKPWPALWSLIFGFFMILVDATIVTVAIPRLATDLDTSLTAVIWVTSAYLLAYAVPLLITGRLGDRFGPRRLYLIGLTVFTASSLWCGLAGSIEMLILARVAQGLGASIMTPQTMAVITRLFPPDKRGAAMGLWGATAGVASLVGPLLGGVLVDGLGWQWIFFVNVPVGIVGFVLAIVNVPVLETHRHRFDWLGVALSAIGMFLVVFGIQEGENFGWGTIAGPISVWSLIIGGAVVLAAFVGWQAYLGRPPEPAGRRTRPRPEPLLPLVLFRDRNFALANLAVTTVGFVVSSMMLPIMLWTQNVHGFTPTQSALLLAPTAVISGVLAPVVGRRLEVWSTRWVASAGLGMFAVGTALYGAQIAANAAWPWLLVPAVVLGLANACTWGPLSVSATRNLPRLLAGAGSGVYNTTRQVGAVLGSAAIAAMMEVRITAELSAAAGSAGGAGAGTAAGASGALPGFLHTAFSRAMGQSEYLPAAVIALGMVAALFLVSARRDAARKAAAAQG
ncbi:DHA2 family efflux MFS transporter permease subunit [Brevibacterium sp. 5221]|uniref:DHA2 family efflux MFS transporter permease subunit n=1 Tax=Brevibacterium rongguiense TaxID=2695267 RepID=A0A6N9H5Y3_9MICO|nr:DHA2 family efflux MFS transporter permease subunit [Brevibacterium rongguiense]MYM19295.1 DHA2 family efflux MFS transporter permease subunit [Brevibacterium rongguiense]